MGVLDKALKGRQYLVGDKCTYADLAFVSFFATGEHLYKDYLEVDAEKFPDYYAWLQRLVERPAVKQVLQGKRED